MSGGDWFRYRRTPGKLSAVPTGPSGWAALAGACVTGAAVALPLSGRWSPLAGMASLAIGLPAAILGINRLVGIPHGGEAPGR